MKSASSITTGIFFCVLAFGANAAERATLTNAEAASRLQREGWTQSSAGVYEKTLANGEKLSMSIGEEGRQHDRLKLQAELASLRKQQAAAKGSEEKTALGAAIEDMQALVDQASIQSATGFNKNSTSAQTPRLGTATTSALLTGHQYSYHDSLTTSACGYDIVHDADMALDAYPGYDDGFAQASVSWAPDAFGPPTTYRMKIGGYAKATNYYGTVTQSIGFMRFGPGSTGSASTAIAETIMGDWDCTLETFTQTTGDANCQVSGQNAYTSFSRSKECYLMIQ